MNKETVKRRRHVQTLLLENGILLIGLDYEGKPVNVINDEFFDQYASAVMNAIDNPAVEGVVICSLKRGNFCAGADLEKIREINEARTGYYFVIESLVTNMHVLLSKIEKSRKPFVAAVDGAALGGGLELTLACHARVISDSPKTVLALPEVKLGIIPGFGGTQRLPRLVGLLAALEMMTRGKVVYARSALKMGLADELVSSIPSDIRTLEEVRKETLLGVAIQKALALSGQKKQKRGIKSIGKELLEAPGFRRVIFKKARALVLEKTGGHYPASLAVIDAVQKGMGMSVCRASQDIEKPILMECFGSRLPRDLMNFYFWGERAEKALPAVSVSDCVGVIGAGKMGWQIANILAEKEKHVVLKDVKSDTLAHAMDAIGKTQTALCSKNIIKPCEYEARMMRVMPTTDARLFSGVGFVVEAVPEDLHVKRIILREFEEVASAEAVFATNTSSFTVSAIAEGATHPERVVGLHFFNPLSKLRLAEVVRTPQSSEAAILQTFSMARELGRIPILVNDGPGFLVNRIASRYLAEAVILAVEGVSISRIDSIAKTFGMAIDSGRTMGPLELIDFVGMHTALQVIRSLKELGKRFETRDYIFQMAPKGTSPVTFWKGTRENPEATKIIREYREAYFLPEKTMTNETIEKRLIFPMVDEAMRCLEENIVAESWQIDLAMLHGVGFPAFRGGLLTWAERYGLRKIADELSALAEAHGRRFEPCDSLRKA